ncbi:uncharacterized protein [Misgurnus anguillicaudatus]|uniref:uncharacterized protein n=1 Tax=Misgurnus anguillicaudatus TaxID=75329 RepID=UPI003CCFA2B1
MEESVHDDPDVEKQDAAIPPNAAMALTEDDVIGQPASVVYHDVLKQLLDYLVLPIERCYFKESTTGTQCNAVEPFEVSLKSRGTRVIFEWGHIVWKWSSWTSNLECWSGTLCCVSISYCREITSRKQRSKTWRMYVLKINKDYSYIQDPQGLILRSRLLAPQGMAESHPYRPDDPHRLGLLSGGTAPSIQELMQDQVSRGLGQSSK